MFSSNGCGTSNRNDPVIRGYQSLVVSEVAKFLDSRGIGSDLANELFAAGQLELVKHLKQVEVVELDGSKVLLPYPGCKRLSKPFEYVRKCVKNAIKDYWQKDRQLAIPPATRRDMVNRGETPPDHKRHSLQSVFYDDGLNEPYHEQEPNARCPWQYPDTPKLSEAIEAFEVIYSLCRDDLDTAIVDARLVGHTTQDVAEQLGLAVSTVSERLNQLAHRYYQLMDREIPIRLRDRPTSTEHPNEEIAKSNNVQPEYDTMTRKEYDEIVRRQYGPPKEPKKSKSKYRGPNVMEIDASRLYKDEDGQWCYRR